MNVETEAVILKTQKYKEYDEIITVFTKKFGKVNMFARSSKRIKSPLLSGTQLFGYVDMEIDLRESGTKLFNSKIKKSYYKFSEDLSKYYFASYICELIEKTQQENQTDTRLFSMIIEVFEHIEKGKCNLKLLRLIFELQLLKSLGITPNLSNCNICNSTDTDILKYIDIYQGSIVCENCVKNNKLKSLVFPEKMESIGIEAFMNNRIEEISFKGKLKHIHHRAFKNNLLTQIQIPKTIRNFSEGIEGIYKSAFDDNPGVKNPKDETDSKVLLWTPRKNNPFDLISKGNFLVDPKDWLT